MLYPTMQGEFSFDALFGNLVNELLPSYKEENAVSVEFHSNITAKDLLRNGSSQIPSDAGKSARASSSPMFPKVDALLSLFKNSCIQLIDLRKQVMDWNYWMHIFFYFIYQNLFSLSLSLSLLFFFPQD